MRQFKTNADLIGIFFKNLLIRHNDKPGGIVLFLIDALPQHRKPINLSRMPGSNGPLAPDTVLSHLPCRKRVIGHTDLLPVLPCQIPRALHQRLGMGIYGAYLLFPAAGHTQQAVLNADNLFPHNIMFKLHQQVIDFTHHAGRGILNGKYGKIRTAFINGAHGLPERVHMKAVNPFAKIRFHRRLGICAFRSLENHSGL